ncbi:uncharacterized protein LOC125285653 [Alosa alosa]|uniref:uncharacterized protein LOC125285653 n=1 Tax=Alosa alosa TaxID=278164 RepID=UPI002015077B|nr:uncharacterized protein LOC125285653 [Alosa alosa]
MDDLLAGSEPHGKLPLKPPLWESIGDAGSSMVPTLALMEMAVAVNCPTRNENEPLDLVMLQRMVAESVVCAKYWSTVTMDLINTCTKVMQSANRDRQWFVHMVQQIEKTMITAVHLQDDRKSHSQEAHNICCPSILRISSDKETEADDERYGLRALVEDCRSRLGSLERVVMQFTEKVEIALNIRHKDKEVPLCHYFREESSSSQASLGMCSSVGSTIERCASIHDTRHIGQYKDAAVQVPEELADTKVEGKANSHHFPDLIAKCEVMEANLFTLSSPDVQLVSVAILQATAIPDSKFEMMERGVLPDSQLCPPAMMRYEQRCEMITETENSKQHLQHTGRDIVKDNVCKYLKVTESLKSEVEEVVEAKLMSSDLLLLTPTIQPHNDLIGTNADVVDGADGGLELLKSLAVHENVGEGTSEDLQLLPDPEDFMPTAEMQATATPDSKFEMMERGVLPDSQLCPPAVMRYEQRCEMIIETENSKQHLQHTGRDIVEDNVCKHLKVTESLKSEVEEVVEAKHLMSSDVLLLTPTIQPHNNLIGTKADVVDGADDGLVLLKSPAVHENVGEGTSEALQLLPDPEDFIPTAEMQAIAIPDSRFEIMEGGVLPDSQLGPPAVPSYEQRFEMITETDQDISKQHLQHAPSDIVKNNVCEHLAVAERLSSEVEEVAEAKLMSSDVILLTPSIQPHNDLIGTNADVVDGADDGLELPKSPAIHENIGEGTSEALQLLPDPEDFMPTAEIAIATPDSRFEIMQGGVLTDSQLGPPAVPSYEQRFEMITETDQDISKQHLQHAPSDIVKNNVCEHLAVAERLSSEVEEVAEAKLMSSDVILLTPTIQTHNNLIGTNSDVVDGADDVLELLKSPAVHENMGEGTSEALQLLPYPEDFMPTAEMQAIAIPDSRFEIMEGGVLPDSQLGPPAIPSYEQRFEIITETDQDISQQNPSVCR